MGAGEVPEAAASGRGGEGGERGLRVRAGVGGKGLGAGRARGGGEPCARDPYELSPRQAHVHCQWVPKSDLDIEPSNRQRTQRFLKQM